MPYEIRQSDNKFCVHKKTGGKNMGCHATRDEAQKQMAALYASEAMSEMLWVDPFAYVEGQPFRVFPIGTFKRGDRVIELTADRLRRIEQNYNSGNHPRWKIPIYFGHPGDDADPPKAGNAMRLEFRDGDGLYAHPEYTDDGKKAVEDGKYQYVSPGIIWAGYTDQDGQEISDVLDHIALTNRPWFGAQTAIFSSDANLMKDSGVMGDLWIKVSELIDMFRDFVRADEPERFKDYDAETRRKMAEKGHAMKDGSYPIADEGDLKDAIHAIGRGKAPHATIRAHIIKRAKAMGKMDVLPEDWKEHMAAHDSEHDDVSPDDMKKKMKKMEDQHMSDAPAINVDEFNALKAKAEQFDALKAQADEFAAKLTAEKTRADEFAAQFAAERKSRALDELKRRAEKFAVALPSVKADEYAEKFYALREKDADLAAWFMAKLDAANAALAQSALFSQFSRGDASTGDENIETVTERILTEQFKGDRAKYAEAFVEAGKQRPDLAHAHYMRH